MVNQRNFGFGLSAGVGQKSVPDFALEDPGQNEENLEVETKTGR